MTSLTFAVLAATNCFAQEPGADKLSFNRHVRPILSNHCIVCHGPDEKNRKADMRLDVPGDADLEELVARITSTDADTMMPPPAAHKPLKPEQIAALKRWVSEGAVYEKHWSFAGPQRPGVPSIGSTWSRQPIDRFVFRRLEHEGLRPSSSASKRTLIRRLALDLTGLPPSLDDIREFLADSSDRAYESLVDRLLAKPQYGEHMARYWLDLVRFSDTNGLHHDHYRDMTPYRDWVIRSFNENLPFDDFATYQVAGDLFTEPTTEQLVASGFNRLHLIIDRGTALPEESFHRNVVDRVTAVGTAFMGLTVQCATCHDHKYDPITQKDFYQLYAFFNNFDGGPETGGRGTIDFKRGLQKPYINLPTPDQEKQLEGLQKEIREAEATVGKSEALVGKKAATKEVRTQLKQATATRNKLVQARDALLMNIPAALVMKERSEVRPTHVLVRGQYDQRGDLVERGTPAFLPAMPSTVGPKSRMDLAKWLVDAKNPLTARVVVNRFWQQFFGVGLVSTSEDFGAQGDVPSHPELLDYLAVEFVSTGWNVKSLVRSIVTSRAYRQTSIADRALYAADPANRLLARGSRFRLDAEVIRDQVLSVTGLLNLSMHGKSVKPPQPPGLWKLVAMPSSYPNRYHPDTGEKIYRRSLYTFWKRGLPPPQMTIFDAPTRESCIARRERTNTPLQALLLMNEEQYFQAAMHYATSLARDESEDEGRKISRAFETMTSQVPDDRTLNRLTNALNDFRTAYETDAELAKAMIARSPEERIRSIAGTDMRTEVCAWTMLVHSLLNLDATKTRE